MNNTAKHIFTTTHRIDVAIVGVPTDKPFGGRDGLSCGGVKV